MQAAFISGSRSVNPKGGFIILCYFRAASANLRGSKTTRHVSWRGCVARKCVIVSEKINLNDLSDFYIIKGIVQSLCCQYQVLSRIVTA